MDFDDLILRDAFFQANTIKGYRYIDTAGQILNDLDDRFVGIQMSPQGMSVSRPIDPSDQLKELRVTPSQIWLHYGPGTGWTQLRQELPDLVERIALVMGVKECSRQGFRTNLLYPVKDAHGFAEKLRERIYNPDSVKWDRLGEPFVSTFHARVRLDSLKASLIIRAVKRVAPQPKNRLVDESEYVVESEELEAVPENAILLDIDIYDDKRPLGIHAKPLINNSLELIRGRVVPFVAPLLEGI